MTGTGDAVSPVEPAMAHMLSFAVIGQERESADRIIRHCASARKSPQWEQFEKNPESLVPVMRSLEDGIENKAVHIQAFDTADVRAFARFSASMPEMTAVSRLVETVVETLAATSTLSSGGDGEIRIRLKSDILDGSSIRMEVKDGELKVIVEPASRAAEEILLKHQEAFQLQLAERMSAWRISVGVAAFDLRNHGGIDWRKKHE